ncbi:MAG TPA: hypothetical protein VFD03_02075 [Clostridia bacterium]|nr:hypothetical protein [Clostridia bacterium]
MEQVYRIKNLRKFEGKNLRKISTYFDKISGGGEARGSKKKTF